MIKRPKIGALSNKDAEGLSYCPDCEKFGVKQKMEERIYLPDPLTGKTVIPADADLWRQCHRCYGEPQPNNSLKQEGRLTTELTLQQSPFDKSKITGIANNHIGKNRRGKDEYDFLQDEGIKRELREGGQLLGYSES